MSISSVGEEVTKEILIVGGKIWCKYHWKNFKIYSTNKIGICLTTLTKQAHIYLQDISNIYCRFVCSWNLEATTYNMRISISGHMYLHDEIYREVEKNELVLPTSTK